MAEYISVYAGDILPRQPRKTATASHSISQEFLWKLSSCDKCGFLALGAARQPAKEAAAVLSLGSARAQAQALVALLQTAAWLPTL